MAETAHADHAHPVGGKETEVAVPRMQKPYPPAWGRTMRDGLDQDCRALLAGLGNGSGEKLDRSNALPSAEGELAECSTNDDNRAW